MMKKHMSHGSPRSIAATTGAGPMEGAGELPAKGPGVAAQRYARGGAAETPDNKTPMGDPKGLSTYKAGSPAPRGYRQ